MEHRWPADVTLPAADLALRERLRLLCEYARLAPSIRNSQPWRFVLHDDAVEVWAVRERGLPVADPDARGLTISCGAALAYLEIAARAASLATTIERLPDPAMPDLLGRLRVTGQAPPATEDPWFFQAIPKRRTHHGVFSGHPVSARLLRRLEELAADAGTTLRFLEGDDRQQLLEQIPLADHEQRQDPAFRAELAAWVGPALSGQRLGLPAHRIETSAMLAGKQPASVASPAPPPKLPGTSSTTTTTTTTTTATATTTAATTTTTTTTTLTTCRTSPST